MKHSRILNKSLFSCTLFCMLLAAATAYGAPFANETEIIFEANSGKTTVAYRGWLEVPENRSKPDSRLITLDYVRFPMLVGESTNQQASAPSTPIVYLAGGPGGSGIGTAKRQRFPLFMAMREFGDVIAFDQRGINENRLPCTSKQRNQFDKIIDDHQTIETMRLAINDCLQHWQQQDIDIYGYTSLESARDLDALRKHLGAEKITLWGTSYGSHLALASLKVMPNKIEKMVLSSVEGLNQTIKLPALTDRYFDRLQSAINKEPDLSSQFPDVKAMIGRVHQRLEAKPLMLTLNKPDGNVTLAFQKRTLQSIASGMVADPASVVRLLSLYQELDQGNTETLVALLSQRYPVDTHVSLPGMSVAMDLASGITQKRYRKVLKQAKTSLLGDRLNFGLHHFNDIPGLDLGDNFRQDPRSEVPTLILSGTLDGRTYLEEQTKVAQNFSRATQIIVENAGHNLFMSSIEVTHLIQQFMRGDTITKKRISVPFVEPAKDKDSH